MALLYPKRTHLLIALILFWPALLGAQGVRGRVTSENGEPLPFASVYLKGGSKGTTANVDGYYALELVPGSYTLLCAYVGYARQEKMIRVQQGMLQQDFVLQEQQPELKEVVVRAGAEDPAYEIIRKAISRRRDHLDASRDYQAMVYMKGLIRTTKVPKSILGVKFNPNRDIIDSSGKGILYFSESVTRYTRRRPNDYREEVVSAKLSGNSQGFGFNSPNDLDISFYENNIRLQGLNSRGFVSPVNDNALQFYRYKFEGSFYEDGVEINRIRVIPRRTLEPVFSEGYIQIVEGSWHIHSLDLRIDKRSQVEIADTVQIMQQMLPLEGGRWMPQMTRIVADFTILGFTAGADFAAVFSDYDFRQPPAGFWKGNIVKTIDTSANKRSMAFWDSLRPVPLTQEERLDYVRKDSLERKFRDPRYLDSLDRISNRFKPMAFFLRGQTFINRREKTRFIMPGVLTGIQYNTVEGWNYSFEPVYRKVTDTGAYTIAPRIRYGFGNGHLNMDLAYTRRIGRDFKKRWTMTASGGKYVWQINPGNPIRPINNTLGTLLYTVNFMKLYEKAYGQISARRVMPNGFTLTMRASFEDRIPLNNTDTTYTWRRYRERKFTSNYPEELPHGFFDRHQALLTTAQLRFQPGQQFIQYPDRRVSLGSDQPVFLLTATQAWKGIFGSDADFGRWSLRVFDDVNMRLAGVLKYDGSVGGFWRNRNVQLPDWQHFMGNQTIVASPYVRSFQLAPYYANSTRDRFYATGHLEWHLNGLITNKIPVLRKANLGLVTGGNGFYVDRGRHYFEVFAGVENILKTFRVDWVWGYDALSGRRRQGIVIGFGGLFTGEGIE